MTRTRYFLTLTLLTLTAFYLQGQGWQRQVQSGIDRMIIGSDGYYYIGGTSFSKFDSLANQIFGVSYSDLDTAGNVFHELAETPEGDFVLCGSLIYPDDPNPGSIATNDTRDLYLVKANRTIRVSLSGKRRYLLGVGSSKGMLGLDLEITPGRRYSGGRDHG